MGDASCNGSSDRCLRSSRKRKSTAERDKDIFEFLNDTTESESYSDSGSAFSGDAPTSNADDSDDLLAARLEETSVTSNVSTLWKGVDQQYLRQIDCSAREVVHHYGSFPPDIDNLQPQQVYEIFFNNDLLDFIAEETNRNARNFISTEELGPKSRARTWRETSSEELRKFFGIVLYTGIVKYPGIHDYWSTNPLYENDLITSCMSRNRFQLLLRFVHFSDNSEGDRTDKSRKFIKVLNQLQDKFCEAFTPGERLTVDETMIPFSGRLSFRQYIPSKSHKYGVKMFKLCNSEGYTLRMQVYTGKKDTVSRNLPADIVMDLSEPYLDRGRTVATDNYFTSVPLARELLRRRTHLVGTLRRTRRHLPQYVVNARLQRDEIVGRVSGDGIVVGKWKDKRDVFFLSTKNDLQMVESEKLRRDGTRKITPAVILDYNRTKQGVDMSDQLASYHSPLRRSIRWYHKVVFEIVLNIAIVNSRIIFNKLTKKNVSMKSFREAIVRYLLGIDEPPFQDKRSSTRSIRGHNFDSTDVDDARGRKLRGKCQDCYSKIASIQGRRAAQNTVKKVNTRCRECEKWLCRNCFIKSH